MLSLMMTRSLGVTDDRVPNGAIVFNHLLVDPSPSSSIGSGIALGDIDGDGKLDVITADGPTFGDPGQPVVAWYKNPGGEDRGNWTKTIIDSQFGGTDDAQVADIRGNGVRDVITSDYNRGQIVWYENPRNSVVIRPAIPGRGTSSRPASSMTWPWATCLETAR
jgi:FG-GAP-like repeat